jgi:hypothetical protein
VSKKNAKSKPIPKLELSEEWMDAQDMKLLFKVTSNTLRNWRKWRIITGSRIGRGYFYNKAQVQQLLIKNLGKGAAGFLFFCRLSDLLIECKL